MVATAETDKKIGVVGSTLLHYRPPHAVQALGGGRFSHYLGRDYQLGRGQRHRMNDRSFDLEHVVGASMLIRTATIRQVGLIEESYFLYREETDWCIQMRQKDWRLRYCPGAIVWHKEGRSIGHRSHLHDYYSVRNMLFLMQKFYPKNLPLAIVYLAVIAIPPKLCRLQFKRLKYVFKAFGDFFRGVQGSGDLLPDFEALAADLASRSSQQEIKLGLREMLAGVEFREIRHGSAASLRPDAEQKDR
jgi:GT2 family glycosyltransferase